MTQTLYATYDGHTLLPEKEIDLCLNQRYLIHIEEKATEEKKQKKTVLQRLSERAMDMEISDLAAQHDHYLYGTDKRGTEKQ